MTLSFTNDQQQEKVADNSQRKKRRLRDAPVLKGTGAGLFLFEVPGTFRTHIVCNPLTQAHFKLPPMSSISQPVIVSGIVGASSSGEAYNVVAVGESRFGEHIVEIYDSSRKSWRVAATLPEGCVAVSEGFSNLRESLVFGNGFLYFGVFRPHAYPHFGMIGFSMLEGTRMTAPIFAPIPTLDCRSGGILLVCGSRLLLVGIGVRDMNSPKEEMVIWEFEKMEPENGSASFNEEIDLDHGSGSFKEIASVTPPFQRSYQRFDCVGVGDRVCFTVHRGKHMEVVVYSLSENSWSFFGSFPISSVTLSHFRVNKAVAFEARPDKKVE